MVRPMKISMIAAHDSNRLIGSHSRIPWHLPRDQQHFRAYTANKSLLLGRRTCDEMLGWFSDHRPIVLTRNANYAPPGAPDNLVLASSIGEAVDRARAAGEEELVVCGGAQIYQLALPVADRLVITQIHAQFEGDSYFPAYSGENWRLVSRQDVAADAENPFPLSFVEYQRREI